MASKRKWTKKRIIVALAAALCALLIVVLLVKPHGTRTYLVIGMDNYGSLNEIGRNDVTMLVQLDFDRRAISAATFARDMFVENESGRSVKINTVVKGSGEQGLVDAIERNFGVRVDGWFRLNFTTVIELVDAMGGVQVELTAKEANYIEREVGHYDDNPLGEGVWRLNGAQALSYARCRKLDNDMGRGERQSKLAAAMVEQSKHISIRSILGIFDALGHAWTSSLSGGEQAGLLWQALWLRGADVARISVPFEGLWRYGEQGGTSGVVANIEKNRDMLLEALGRESAAQTED